MKTFVIEEKFVGYADITIDAETEQQAIDLFNEGSYDDNADVSIREVTLGGDPVEDFVSYHPTIGASDDELTKICDDIYQTLMGAFVAQMMEIS